MSIEPTLIAAMDCRELERSVDAFLDAEFDERERAEAEAHLAGCPRCRSMVEAQVRVRNAIRAKLREAMSPPAPAGSAPAALRARLRQALAKERQPLWRRALAPLPLATVAACAAGVLVVLASHSGNPDLLEDAIRNHHRGLPLEVDAAAMPGWFTGKLDFRPALPRFSGHGIRVEGARLSNLREWPAAYVRYQLPRGQAGLFIVDDPGRRFDAPGRDVRVGNEVIRLASARGYNVAIWRQDEIVYSLVSDLDEDALFQLVQAAQLEAEQR
ncbi:MAG TPA: zf-HC2 domain-containing protein [Anaeromyxobacter sp.]|nr:zf-HC2 domain-containing protein [Anaeromyxobacter sp.]